MWTPTRPITSTTTVAGLLLAAALLGACGPATSTPAEPSHPPVVDEDRPAREHDTDVDDTDVDDTDVDDTDADDADAAPEDGTTGGRAVRLTDHLDVLAAPQDDAEVVRRLEPTTGFGSTTVAAVADEHDGWFELVLPGRPTDLRGFVRVDAPGVEVVATTLEVRVDLDARELTVVDGDEVLLTTTVAIGDADHPTPTGRAFLTDKLDTQDPDGPYGPFALGLSVRSEVLTEFAGGDGQIGIHGTNDPSSLGRAVSHGCVRVPNDVVRRLVELLPLGTPVVVS